jgi:hypothetical protein
MKIVLSALVEVLSRSNALRIADCGIGHRVLGLIVKVLEGYLCFFLVSERRSDILDD